MAIRYQRRIQRSKPNIEAAHSIDSKRNRLQKLMDAFEIQADQYLHQLCLDDSPISTMADYEEFDVRDGPDNSTHTYADPSDHHEVRPSDGSGIDIPNIEDQPVLLPSSLGWSGAYAMVSNILHSRKHNYDMLKQMILSIISASHLGLNPLYSALRFDLLALKKQRLVLGMPLTVLTQLFRNMHANIA